MGHKKNIRYARKKQMTIGLITFIVIVILVNIMMLIQLRSNQIRAQKHLKYWLTK